MKKGGAGHGAYGNHLRSIRKENRQRKRIATQRAGQSISGGANKTATPPEPKTVLNGEILVHGYTKKGGIRVKAHTRVATSSQALKRSAFIQARGSTKRGRPTGSKKGRR